MCTISLKCSLNYFNHPLSLLLRIQKVLIFHLFAPSYWIHTHVSSSHARTRRFNWYSRTSNNMLERLTHLSVSVCVRHVIFFWLSAWVTLLSVLLPNSSFTPVDRVLWLLLCSWLLYNSHYTCVCVPVHQMVFCRGGTFTMTTFHHLHSEPPFFRCHLYCMWYWDGSMYSAGIEGNICFSFGCIITSLQPRAWFPSEMSSWISMFSLSSMCSGFIALYMSTDVVIQR